MSICKLIFLSNSNSLVQYLKNIPDITIAIAAHSPYPHFARKLRQSPRLLRLEEVARAAWWTKNFANLWLTRSGNMASQNPATVWDFDAWELPPMDPNNRLIRGIFKKPVKLKVWRVRLETWNGGRMLVKRKKGDICFLHKNTLCSSNRFQGLHLVPCGYIGVFCIAFLPPHKVAGPQPETTEKSPTASTYTRAPLILRINPEGWAHRCHWRLFLLHVFRHPKLEMVRIHLPCNKWRKGDGKRKKKTPTYESWNGERSMIVQCQYDSMCHILTSRHQQNNEPRQEIRVQVSTTPAETIMRSNKLHITNRRGPQRNFLFHKEARTGEFNANKSIRNLALKPRLQALWFVTLGDSLCW